MYRFALVTSTDLLSTAINDCWGWGANYPDVLTAVYVAPMGVQEMDLTSFDTRVSSGGIVFVVESRPLSDAQYETLRRIDLRSLEIVPDSQMPVTETPTGYRLGIAAGLIRDVIHARGYINACWDGSVSLQSVLETLQQTEVVEVISCCIDDPPIINNGPDDEVMGMLMIDDQWSVEEFETAAKRIRDRIVSNVKIEIGFFLRFSEFVGRLFLIRYRKRANSL